jgi:glycosyltransferase involved in cell wall biosynthesis
MKISAVMIAKNEEVFIKPCLDSLRGFDEIVVVDTGSIDNTKEIAKEHKRVTLGEFPWCDDFAAARNHALSLATGDWCMSIDADHVLLSEHTDVRRAIRNLEKAGQKIGYITLRHVNGATHRAAWLFKRDPELVWKGRIHEHIAVPATVDTSVLQVYAKSPAHQLDPDRNLRILQLSDQSDRRVQFYLGREWAERNQPKLAIEFMQKYLAQATWLPEICEAHLTIARAYWSLGDGNAARSHCLEAVRNNPAFKEALLFMADLHYEPWKAKWVRLAEVADNEGVLFVRRA